MTRHDRREMGPWRPLLGEQLSSWLSSALSYLEQYEVALRKAAELARPFAS